MSNETTQPIAGGTASLDPAVRGFVVAVRSRLADLTDEEREELVGGLDADMGDLVAERGLVALPDPASYAAELRSAAGFSAVATGASGPPKPRLGERVTTALDRAHARWQTFAEALPGGPWEIAVSLRPVWWVLRAWVALQVVDLLWGTGSINYGLSVVPSLYQWGLPLLVVAVALSVQVGRGRLWPGRDRRGAVGRVLLLGLNLLAVAALPVTLDSVATPASMEASRPSSDSGYEQGYADARSELDRAGMYVDGRWVSNIYPYDATGRPLVGVQLFDQTGKPVAVKPQAECVYSAAEVPLDRVRVFYPWITVAGQARNVYPVPSRVQASDETDADPAAFTGNARPQVGQFPVTRVPAAGLPGLLTSRGTTPARALTPGALPKLPVNSLDEGC